MITPGSPTPRSVPTKRPPPRPGYYAERWPGSPTAASACNGCCPTTARPTSPPCGRTPAPNWTSPRNGPDPTDPKPTAKLRDSTAPCPTAGPTPASTPTKPAAAPHYPAGCTSTITTDPTPQPEANHPSPD